MLGRGNVVSGTGRKILTGEIMHHTIQKGASILNGCPFAIGIMCMFFR
jgi:hypothetical protein